MTKEIRPIEEVAKFLEESRSLIDAGRTRINNVAWADGKVNKTQKYMAESGIGRAVVREVVKELNVTNYCITKEDKNPHFPNEVVWEFGITKNLVDKVENLYIKLKIRELKGGYLLIMSFHPEQPERPEDKLKFPYAGYEE